MLPFFPKTGWFQRMAIKIPRRDVCFVRSVSILHRHLRMDLGHPSISLAFHLVNSSLFLLSLSLFLCFYITYLMWVFDVAKVEVPWRVRF